MSSMSTEGQPTQQQTRQQWVKRWWPVVFVSLFLLWGIVAFYIRADTRDFELIKFLVQGVVALALIFYVTYTKDLATYSQQTALANKQIVESMQSLIAEQWEAKETEGAQLILKGEDLSREIYVHDKDWKENDYDEYIGRKSKRVLFFKPMNNGTRTVFLKSVKLEIADSRMVTFREISYDPEPPRTLHKDESIEIPVVYDIEGVIEARVSSIRYQDGNLEQTTWIARPFRETRYTEAVVAADKEDDDLPF